MAGDDDLEKRLRKLEGKGLVPQQVGRAVHQALAGGDLSPEGTLLGKAVRDVLATIEAIEVVQEGVPYDEWTEEDEQNSLGKGFSGPT